MLEVNENTRELIPEFVTEWLVIGDKNYFIKRQRTKLDYCEIVAEKIAIRLGIINAHYEGLKVGYKLYFLSEDLNNLGIFKTISEYHPQNISLYSYWYLFENYYPDYSKRLLDELIKVFLLDIIIMNPDRNPANWGIIITSTGPHICILDNELMLKGNDVKISSFYTEKGYLDSLKSQKENLKELDYFLATSSEEYIFLFGQMLDTITPEVFEEILTEIEAEYQDTIEEKSWALDAFSRNYFKLSAILEPHLNRYSR